MKRGRSDASAGDEPGPDIRAGAPGRVSSAAQRYAAPTVHDVATIAVERKDAGRAVDPGIAGAVGAHLGHDFSSVRVHGDPLARQATAAMGARAFAHGGDIFLGPNESDRDLGLMAHELTHVGQQGAAARTVPMRQVQVGAANSPAEHQADAVAAQVTAGGRPAALLVDDGAVQPGQMLKSQFLDQLRAEVTAAANAELGPAFSAVGCPYIEQYFGRYSRQPAAATEALLQRYAPGARGAASAAAMIPLVVARVREGTRAWRDTGRAPDLPEDAGAGAGAAIDGGPAAAAMGPGQALGGGAAARMSEALGDSVADARIHLGPEAQAFAARHDALAVTMGPHVAFAAGAYAPGTPEGDALLAHELAHVVQQRGASPGDAAATDSSAHEQDADRAAAGGVARLWRGGLGAAQQVGPTLRAGFGLQRCNGRPDAQHAAGEKWPGGPTVTRKSTNHTLAEYVGWLRQVEGVYGAQRGSTLQRLRRLYYSDYTGGAGPRFDTVINSAPQAGGPPMIVPELPLAVINGLFETNAIITPNGSQVDVSHIFAGLDVHVQGGGIFAGAGELRFDVNFEGVLTWVGDLASWFIEAKQAVKARQAGGATVSQADQVGILLGLVNNKAAKDDLLGDADAQVMADRFTTTTVLPPMGDSPGVGSPTILTTQDIPLSEMLTRYYGGEPVSGGAGGGGGAGAGAGGGGGAAASTSPNSSNRFHHFVAGAIPRIPHSQVSASPLRVALGGDASTQIRQYISNTARMFIDQGYFSGTPADLTTYAGLLDEVNTRFVRFLTTGLSAGDASWP